MADLIQFRRDTASAWVTKNPILADGEIGLEQVTGLFKIGNGTTPWNTLNYGNQNSITNNSALLTVVTDDDITPPQSDQLRLYAASIANRVFPKFMGPSGLSTSVQPLLARNKIGYWCPPGSNGLPGIFGYTAPTALGTAVSRVVGVTNLFSRMRRYGYNSAATINAQAGNRVAIGQVTLSNGLGEGGFFKVVRWGNSDPSVVTTARCFIGVTSSTAVLANVEPSTYTNVIGMGSGVADTTMQIFYGGSVAQTPINLGPNFPANTSNIDVYELTLFAPPNFTGIHWEVTRLNTGHVAKGTIENLTVGVTLPSHLTLLSYQNCMRCNTTTAAIVGIDIMSDYIETDY